MTATETILSDTMSHPDEVSVEAELARAAQLIQLASSHQRSDYNQFKFGPRGSPVSYVPLSFHCPNRVQQLQECHSRLFKGHLWCISEKQAVSSVLHQDAQSASALSPCEPSRQLSGADLKEELSAAMTAPLDTLKPMLPVRPSTQLHLKTSQTHPIQVSAIVPFELLYIISCQPRPASAGAPVMLDLPPACYLDQATAYAHIAPSDVWPRIPVSLTPDSIMPPSSAFGSERPVKFPQFLWAVPTLKRAFCLAAGTDRITSQAVYVPALGSRQGPYEGDVIQAGVRHPTTVMEHSAGKKLPEHGLRRSFSEPVMEPVLIPDLDCAPKIASSENTVPHVLPRFVGPRSFCLGNLFLSSCPGKKVRLSGAVKGRAAICRDLRADLQRIRDLGAKCIVCCLDDEELELLGVSWPDYLRTANELGIDILRVPMPEGLAPLSVEAFDKELDTLIKIYTLRGANVLVHCRGGIGRAGLVACCWIMKLGLCGWIETTPHTSAVTAPDNTPQAHIPQTSAPQTTVLDKSGVRRDTLHMVERVISVVRRRRSLKAVETYEQVKFLADFVELLRARSTVSAVDMESISHLQAHAS